MSYVDWIIGGLSIAAITSILTWLVDKVLQARDSRLSVNALAQEAFLVGDPNQIPHIFVKVTNNSLTRDVTVTHVWYQGESNRIDILNPQRVLPFTIKPTKQWETWFPRPSGDLDSILNKVHVRLSNQQELISTKNKDVPPAGFIAGN